MIIKRYKNRKLYVKAEGYNGYTSSAEVADIIRSGRPFEFIDMSGRMPQEKFIRSVLANEILTADLKDDYVLGLINDVSKKENKGNHTPEVRVARSVNSFVSGYQK